MYPQTPDHYNTGTLGNPLGNARGCACRDNPKYVVKPCGQLAFQSAAINLNDSADMPRITAER